MKTYLISLIIVLQLFSFTDLVSQNLVESIGGYKTNYIITSDSIVINNKSQVLIRRAESNHISSANAGYGYGYESLHLEFISKDSIVTIERSKRSLFPFYVIQFYDVENSLIAQKYLMKNDIDILKNKENLIKTYSIELKDIPVSVLEITKKVNIYFSHYSKKKKKKK